MEEAPRKFFRLKPGGEVRLRNGYIIRCDEVIKNDAGEIVELRCSYDPDTRSGTGSSDRKVKGTIHWVSAAEAIAAEVRLYDRLFATPAPNSADDFMQELNPESLTTVTAMLEPSLAEIAPGEAVQLSVLATSARTRKITLLTRRYSTASSRCVIPGRRLRNRLCRDDDGRAALGAKSGCGIAF